MLHCYSRAGSLSSTIFYHGSPKMTLRVKKCNGDEMTLLKCDDFEIKTEPCKDDTYAVAMCYGKVRDPTAAPTIPTTTTTPAPISPGMCANIIIHSTVIATTKSKIGEYENMNVKIRHIIFCCFLRPISASSSQVCLKRPIFTPRALRS